MVSWAKARESKLINWYADSKHVYRKRMALGQLIKGICYALHYKAVEKGIRLHPSVESIRHFTELSFDPAKSVFKNLITNSIKYGREGGSIQIWNEGLTLYFKDDGHGMHPNFAARLGRGTTLREERIKGVEGTGLGWDSIGIVAKHLGWSWDIETEINKGTTVTLRLNEQNFLPPKRVTPPELLRPPKGIEQVSADEIIDGAKVFKQAVPFKGYKPKGDRINVIRSPIFKAVGIAQDLMSRLP
jgi:hypothetical protein